MYLHKFSKDDILFNVIKTNPKVSFKIYDGKVWDNDYNIDFTMQESCGDGTFNLNLSCDDNSYIIPTIF